VIAEAVDHAGGVPHTLLASRLKIWVREE